jgi:His-Xaa-Ser system protein HxsD
MPRAVTLAERMSEITVHRSDAELVLELDETLYPKDAIYGSAYVFIDRCYVLLDRPRAGRISVRLKPKPGVTRALDDLAGEFENELLGQAWRRLILEENRELIESVTTRALSGAAGPPGLDELLQMGADEDAAFDDPLGIAVSWEEKYKKRAAGEGGGGEGGAGSK